MLSRWWQQLGAVSARDKTWSREHKGISGCRVAQGCMCDVLMVERCRAAVATVELTEGSRLRCKLATGQPRDER